MFEQMIEDWFSEYTPAYNGFVKALLGGGLREMNHYMNQVAMDTFSFSTAETVRLSVQSRNGFTTVLYWGSWWN